MRFPNFRFAKSEIKSLENEPRVVISNTPFVECNGLMLGGQPNVRSLIDMLEVGSSLCSLLPTRGKIVGSHISTLVYLQSTI